MANKAEVSPETTSFLPALEIKVRGEVVTSNAEAFRDRVTAWVAAFNTDLTEDEHFVQAEADAKTLKEAEEKVKAAKEKALQDAVQIHALFSLLDDTDEVIRQARLNLEKKVKAKKEEIRSEIVEETVAAVHNGHGESFRKEIVEAVKGKRTIATIREAAQVVSTYANSLIQSNHKTLEAFVEKNGRELVPDRHKLEISNSETLLIELQRRVETKRAEDERRRLEEEARLARAEAEAAKKAAEEDLFAAPPPDAVVGVDPGPPEGDASVTIEKPVSEPKSDPTDGEMEAFEQAVLTAFAPLKEARTRLQHPDNIQRATRFAEAVNAAWTELTK